MSIMANFHFRITLIFNRAEIIKPYSEINNDRELLKRKIQRTIDLITRGSWVRSMQLNEDLINVIYYAGRRTTSTQC
jgi:hypothetical protein